MPVDVKGVRDALYELTSFYFKGATITFARQSGMAKQKKGKPLVVLTTGPVTRPVFPPTKIIDGRPVSFYPSSVTVQIDLFTLGEKKELANGYTAAMENTAADDMMSFREFSQFRDDGAILPQKGHFHHRSEHRSGPFRPHQRYQL